MDNMDLGKLIKNKMTKPVRCSKCNAILTYSGVGEYTCPDCNNKEYDDYGLVRNYIEQNPEATVAEVELYTGVTKDTIKYLIETGRISLVKKSRINL